MFNNIVLICINILLKVHVIVHYDFQRTKLSIIFFCEPKYISQRAIQCTLYFPLGTGTRIQIYL